MARTKVKAVEEAMSADQLQAEQITKEANFKFPNDPKAQAVYFFQKFRIPAAKGRARSVSKLTTLKYLSTVESFINELKANGTNVKSIGDLTSRQLVSSMRSWEKQGKSSSTLANRYSVLVRFLGWQKTTVPYRSVHEVLIDKERGKRSTSVTESKAWSANGVVFEDVLSQLALIDKYAALQLQMAAAFGLRVQEACAIRPYESDQNDYLIVHLGAKGGRGRTVKISTAYQREVLNKAKEFVTTQKTNGFIRKHGQSIKSAINRFYYCLRLVSVNKKGLGVSAHGLRHEYANELYAANTGHNSPVNLGAKVDLEVDHAARKVVTEALGHSRLSITSAYLGSHRMMDRAAKKYLQSLNLLLTNGDSKLTAIYRKLNSERLDRDTELRLFLVGLAAEGKKLAGTPITVSAGFFTLGGFRSAALILQEEKDSIAAACTEITGQWTVCIDDSKAPVQLERFELLFVD